MASPVLIFPMHRIRRPAAPRLDAQGRPPFAPPGVLRAVLFDLDGTLVDSAPDVTLALNRTLAEPALGSLPKSTVRNLIGRGALDLVQRAIALAEPTAAPRYLEPQVLAERYRELALELEQSLDSRSLPYAGASAVLQLCVERGLRVAVVTNKSTRIACSLLERFHLLPWVEQVVGWESCARHKPDPEPLLHACRLLGVLESEVVMVGDSLNDVTAARAANIPVLCVPYGYNEGQDPRLLDCDALLEDLPALAQALWPAALR